MKQILVLLLITISGFCHAQSTSEGTILCSDTVLYVAADTNVPHPFLKPMLIKNKPPYVSYVIFGGCAVADGVMDELFDHFTTSAFKGLNPNFWNPNISWEKSRTILGYHIDAWHLTKSALIIGLTAAVLTYRKPAHFHWWKEVLIYGVVWNSVFDLTFGGLSDKKIKL